MANDVGIIILAGGKSSRMGEDKGLMEVNQQPIIQYLLNTCESISTEIIIVTNNEDYKKFGYPIVTDRVSEIGPIGGLHAGLLASKYHYNIVLSCDVPLVSAEILSSLVAEARVGNDIVITRYMNQHHPLIGLYSKQILNLIETQIENKRYQLSQIYQSQNAKVLDLSHFPAKEFINLNTKNDIETFKKLMNDC